MKSSRIYLVLSFIMPSLAFLPDKNGLADEYVVIKKDTTAIFEMKLPEGYATRYQLIEGGAEPACTVPYPDGAVLYCADHNNIPSEAGYTMLDFVTADGAWQPDTVRNGLQPDGRCWKVVFRQGWFVGYKNVRKERAGIFDRSLQTLRVTAVK